MKSNVNEVTIRDYLRAIFNHKILFIVIPFLIIIPTYIALEMRTPVYSASVTMFVKAQKQIESDYYQGVKPLDITSEHIELVNSNAVISRVVKALKLYDIPVDDELKYATPLRRAYIKYKMKTREQLGGLLPEQLAPEQRKQYEFLSAVARLKSRVSAMPVRESGMYILTVTDFNSARATKIANAVSRSYVIFDLEQQIAELKMKYGEKYSTVLQLQNYIMEFEKTLHGEILPDIDAMGPASVKIIQQAQYGQLEPGAPKLILLIFAFITSVFVSIAFTYIFEYLDNTFKSPLEVVRFLGIPVLGTIPMKRPKNELLKDIVKSDSGNYVRSYHELSEQIYLGGREKKLKSLLIVDAEGLKATATIVSNLATDLAGNQQCKVLLIDTNLRAASISDIFDISNNPGLGDVLKEKIPFEGAVKELESNLYVLPSGNSIDNPVPFLESSKMSELLVNAGEQFDMTLVYCADLKNYKDALVLSSFMDGVVLVVNENKTHRMAFKSAITPLLEKENVNVAGIILNNRTYVIPNIIYKIT